MRYINPYYMLFSNPGASFKFGKEAGVISTKGRCYHKIKGGNHIRVSFDVNFVDRVSALNQTYLLNLYFSDWPDAIGSSTAQLHFNSSNGLSIAVNGKTQRKSQESLIENKWYHVYFEADTIHGVIVVYLDGAEICRYEDYVTSGVTLEQFAIYPYMYANSVYIAMKNIIVTDEQLSLSETVQEIDVTVENIEWTESDGIYSADETGKRMNIKPAVTELDGKFITGAELIFLSGSKSENVPALEVAFGEHAERVELPSSGQTFSVTLAGVQDIAVISSE